MVTNKFLFVIIAIGLLTLFFFPEPETNFIAYLGTAIFFIVIIITILIIKIRKTKKFRIKIRGFKLN